MTDRAPTEEGLREARRKAQEAREDAEAYASPVHSTHDLADLIDALAGEVERLEAKGNDDRAVLIQQIRLWSEECKRAEAREAELSRRLEEAHEALRYIADFDTSILQFWGEEETAKNQASYGFLAGALQGRARAALGGSERKEGGA